MTYDAVLAVPVKLPTNPDDALTIEAVNGPVIARVPLTKRYCV